MDDKLFWAGMLCIFASIVGGGFEALGVKIPVLKERGTRVALGALGFCLLFITKWPQIQLLLPPYGPQTVTSDPVLLAPSEVKSFTLEVGRPGRVTAILNNFSPQWDPKLPHSGSPGLYISICQSEEEKPCKGYQRGADQQVQQQALTGPVTVSFFNFGSNPPIKFTPTLQFPKQAVLHLPQ